MHCAETEEIIVATGTFTHEGDLNVFLDTLKESELGKKHHHAEQMEVANIDHVFRVVLQIKDYAGFLVKSSFRDGMLCHWAKQFTIAYPT